MVIWRQFGKVEWLFWNQNGNLENSTYNFEMTTISKSHIAFKITYCHFDILPHPPWQLCLDTLSTLNGLHMSGNQDF